MKTVFAKHIVGFGIVLLAAFGVAGQCYAEENSGSVFVALNRSTVVTLEKPASEVVVANPDIADVHVHNSTHVSLIAKSLGRTTVTIVGKDHNIMREVEVVVGYDLPAIRRALKNFLPDETIGVEMVNNGVALTGQVKNAMAVERALKIAKDFIHSPTPQTQSDSGIGAALNPLSKVTNAVDQATKATAQDSGPDVLNFLQITSGQQVMLRVRVGEIKRSALKALGMDLNGGISNGFQFATGTAGLGGLLQPNAAPANSNIAYGPGHLLFPTDSNNVPTNTQGLLSGKISKGRNTLAGALQALEQDGLFKLLAEPNLVAVSGEQAEFLAGGEIPIPVPQGSGSGGTTISIQYKPYGVAVRFKPIVLTETRIHMEVEPEVSELDTGNAVKIDGVSVPALTTRRAKTTVELAPGEGFMIAGLLKDQSDATINQLPGVMDIPVLGALFRSTDFQRNETELVIAVTPYVVDPVKSADIKLPTDDFRPASDLEMFFYGALGSNAGGSNTGKTKAAAPAKGLEGPTGFMVD